MNSSLTPTTSRKRIDLAKKALRENNVDALIFFNGDRYGGKIAGTAAFTALILFPDNDPSIIAHSIERGQAESESGLEIDVIQDTRMLKDSLNRLIPRRTGSTKVAIIPWNTSFEKAKVLQELDYEILDASENILPSCLRKPFPEEIHVIRGLSSICDKALEAAHGAVGVGRHEYEIAAVVDYEARRHGITEFSFPTVIASGYRAAFPHGGISSKVIGEGDPVVVDVGPILDGYDGDVCRTFIAGNKTAWRRELEVVQEAIHMSLEAIKSQEIVKAAHIDNVAREVVRKAGYRTWPDEMRTVWTGHPVGGFSSPAITSESQDEIEDGMVFTIEPGIYEKGKGGVRIEHHVLAKKYDYELLDEYPE